MTVSRKDFKIHKSGELSMDHNPPLGEKGRDGPQYGGLFLNGRGAVSSFGTGRKERGEGST